MHDDEESLQPLWLHFQTLTALLLGTRPPSSDPPHMGDSPTAPAGVSGLVLEKGLPLLYHEQNCQAGRRLHKHSVLFFSIASEAGVKVKKGGTVCLSWLARESGCDSPEAPSPSPRPSSLLWGGSGDHPKGKSL